MENSKKIFSDILEKLQECLREFNCKSEIKLSEKTLACMANSQTQAENTPSSFISKKRIIHRLNPAQKNYL